MLFTLLLAFLKIICNNLAINVWFMQPEHLMLSCVCYLNSGKH